MHNDNDNDNDNDNVTTMYLDFSDMKRRKYVPAWGVGSKTDLRHDKATINNV